MRPWVVEVGCDSDRELVRSLRELTEVTEVPWNPFDKDPLEIHEGSIVHGSIEFLQRCQRGSVFYVRERFSWWACMNHWGRNRLLNVGTPMTFKAFLNTNLNPYGRYHVRPIYEGKAFPGSVGALWELQEKLQLKYHVDPTEMILVSEVAEILSEYRSIVVNGVCVSSSLYKRDGRSLTSEVFGLESLVEDFARIYSPHRVFALDLALTPYGYKIIEPTLFNAAGFYACDVHKIARALE